MAKTPEGRSESDGAPGRSRTCDPRIRSSPVEPLEGAGFLETYILSSARSRCATVRPGAPSRKRLVTSPVTVPSLAGVVPHRRARATNARVLLMIVRASRSHHRRSDCDVRAGRALGTPRAGRRARCRGGRRRSLGRRGARARASCSTTPPISTAQPRLDIEIGAGAYPPREDTR